jgi:predicted deacylase
MALEKRFFDSEKSGPNLLISGRVHGNEPCGEMAIRQLIDQLDAGEIILNRGTLTVLPRCNPAAAKTNQRFIDRNLNRIMHDMWDEKITASVEAPFVTFIKHEINRCDYFIDLHSTTEAGDPFVICAGFDFPDAVDFAKSMHIERLLDETTFPMLGDDQTTIGYATSQGKCSILIECGQHDAPTSINIAYRSILFGLHHLGMVNMPHLNTQTHHKLLNIEKSLMNEKGKKLIFPLMKRDYICIGDPLFETDSGHIIHSDVEGVLMMRNINTPIGEEYALICVPYRADVDGDI